MNTEDSEFERIEAEAKRRAAQTWDKTSASFGDWWDSDRHDNANPFYTDSFAYWAWEGWQAAQRQWVELKEKNL